MIPRETGKECKIVLFQRLNFIFLNSGCKLHPGISFVKDNSIFF